jgi:hypothetical protein
MRKSAAGKILHILPKKECMPYYDCYVYLRHRIFHISKDAMPLGAIFLALRHIQTSKLQEKELQTQKNMPFTYTLCNLRHIPNKSYLLCNLPNKLLLLNSNQLI